MIKTRKTCGFKAHWLGMVVCETGNWRHLPRVLAKQLLWFTRDAGWLVVLCLMAACGGDPEAAPKPAPLPPVQYVDDSTYPVSFAERVEATAESIIDHEIDLDGYTIHMTSFAGGGCDGTSEPAAACTNLDSHTMASPFVDAKSLPVPADQAELNLDAAGTFCHELMHIYCWQTTNDAYCGCPTDKGHDYCAPFDYLTKPDSPCYQVAQLFNVEQQ